MKNMTYKTCIKVIEKVKGEKYLACLIKEARSLYEFTIVDSYDEINWEERTLMPLLRKEAREALGEEPFFPSMSYRISEMRWRKRMEEDYILHPEKYIRMPDGHLRRARIKAL